MATGVLSYCSFACRHDAGAEDGADQQVARPRGHRLGCHPRRILRVRRVKGSDGAGRSEAGRQREAHGGRRARAHGGWGVRGRPREAGTVAVATNEAGGNGIARHGTQWWWCAGGAGVVWVWVWVRTRLDLADEDVGEDGVRREDAHGGEELDPCAARHPPKKNTVLLP